MAVLTLRARRRQETGKGAARALRRQALVPAVFYGPGVQAEPLALEMTELQKLLGSGAGENILIDLKIGNGGQSRKHRAMIKEIQLEPLKRTVLHVDLYAISMDKKITVEVPIVLTGVPVGVSEGGILQQVQRSLEVSCLPGRIPEALELDVSSLAIGDSLHVSDIRVPRGVELLAGSQLTIVSVVPPTRAEEIGVEALEEEEGEEVERETIEPEEKGEG